MKPDRIYYLVQKQFAREMGAPGTVFYTHPEETLEMLTIRLSNIKMRIRQNLDVACKKEARRALIKKVKRLGFLPGGRG